MFGVTGFVTILYNKDDERPRVFSRYFHVRRVAWTARLIAQQISPSASIHLEYLDWLAWAHDLNRWPFSHNSERGFFDQAQDVPRYLRDAGLDVACAAVRDLQGIISKEFSFLGVESRLVLLADIITGFIEDPIWLTAALDVAPTIIPKEVSEYLCIPFQDSSLILRLKNLSEMLKPGLDCAQFLRSFDNLFIECLQRYVATRNIATVSTPGSQDFEDKRRWIKEDFMRNVIFPYNNEKISHGTRIKEELVLPMIQRLGDSAAARLTKMTDAQMIDEAITQGLIGEEDKERYVPNLNYMKLNEPDNTFTNYCDRRI
jgi:hypothetical protein